MDKVKPRKSANINSVGFEDDLHIKSQTIRTRCHGKADPVLVEIVALQAEEIASLRRNLNILSAQFMALKDVCMELGATASIAVDELNKERSNTRKGVSVGSEEIG